MCGLFLKIPKNRSELGTPTLMDFLDGITFQRFDLEGWDLVQCLLISLCFGSEKHFVRTASDLSDSVGFIDFRY